MRRRRLLLVAAVLGTFGTAAPLARAKLDAEQWKQVQNDAAHLFLTVGNAEDKASVVKKLVEDDDARSWKILGDVVVKEAGLWTGLQGQVNEKVLEIGEIQAKPFSQRVPEDQKHLTDLSKDLSVLETQLRNERGIYDAIVGALAAGPEALRKNLLARGKASPDWAVRAAAARVAGTHPEEKESGEFLQRSLEQDKDPRVRLAAVEVLAEAQAGWEDFVIGRFADTDWGVQLRAVRIAGDRKLRRAVPHLINALDRARPRVAEDMAKVLRDLTGQNFDTYADVWAKWWADHKAEFEAAGAAAEVKAGGKPKPPADDVKYYGIPIKSDRVLFIIDISGSMNEPTKKQQAPTPPAPKGPTTPGEGQPPQPPPPDEVAMSGRKIDVAKAELKKAVKKLPKAAKFNIIAFSLAVRPWSKTMMDAKDDVKEEALRWIQALDASGATFTDGALREGFHLAGLAAVDKAYTEVTVDTIFLMSDGVPTTDEVTDAAKRMDPKIILDHVKEWNAQKRVVINTIAMDLGDDDVGFLKDLAAQNDGTFVVVK